MWHHRRQLPLRAGYRGGCPWRPVVDKALLCQVVITNTFRRCDPVNMQHPGGQSESPLSSSRVAASLMLPSLHKAQHVNSSAPPSHALLPFHLTVQTAFRQAPSQAPNESASQRHLLNVLQLREKIRARGLWHLVEQCTQLRLGPQCRTRDVMSELWPTAPDTYWAE